MEFEFERKAMKSDPVPFDLDLADTVAYIGLRYIYDAYKKRMISREDARQEKDALVNAWNLHKSKIVFLERQADILHDRIGDTSEEYRKNPTIENADKMYAAFYGLKDDWRERD